MATLAERGKNNWAARGIMHRDFRHTHDEPEVAPHKKKKNNKGAKRADHKHIWETNGPVIHTFGSGNSYAESRYECLECGVKGNTVWEWNYKN